MFPVYNDWGTGDSSSLESSYFDLQWDDDTGTLYTPTPDWTSALCSGCSPDMDDGAKASCSK